MNARDSDPNASDPELIRKLWARDGVVVNPGDELTEEQAAVLRRRLDERKAAREARMDQMMRKFLPDSELTAEELAARRAEQERIDKERYEALVEKERARYEGR
jgi:hypothetical protein